MLDGEVGGAAHGAHEARDLLRVLLEVVAVGHVLDGAEAAAAEIVELIDAQHAGVLGGELLELDALEVGEADARVDVAAEDGGGDVHADAHGLVRVEWDAGLLGEVVDHHLAEVADVPDLGRGRSGLSRRWGKRRRRR